MIDSVQKPPSAWKESGRKVLEVQTKHNPQEPVQGFQERESKSGTPAVAQLSPSHRYVDSLRSSHGDYEITPKPNEIVFSGIDFKSTKNVITKHHLDDSET